MRPIEDDALRPCRSPGLARHGPSGCPAPGCRWRHAGRSGGEPPQHARLAVGDHPYRQGDQRDDAQRQADQLRDVLGEHGQCAARRAPERAAPAVWSGSASACGHNADNEGHDEPRHGDERGNAEDQAKIWAVTLREVPMVHGVRRRLSQRWRILRHANPPGTRCPELSGFRAAGRARTASRPLIPEHHLFAANRIVANGLQREA